MMQHRLIGNMHHSAFFTLVSKSKRVKSKSRTHIYGLHKEKFNQSEAAEQDTVALVS